MDDVLRALCGHNKDREMLALRDRKIKVVHAGMAFQAPPKHVVESHVYLVLTVNNNCSVS